MFQNVAAKAPGTGPKRGADRSLEGGRGEQSRGETQRAVQVILSRARPQGIAGVRSAFLDNRNGPSLLHPGHNLTRDSREDSRRPECSFPAIEYRHSPTRTLARPCPGLGIGTRRWGRSRVIRMDENGFRANARKATRVAGAALPGESIRRSGESSLLSGESIRRPGKRDTRGPVPDPYVRTDAAAYSGGSGGAQARPGGVRAPDQGTSEGVQKWDGVGNRPNLASSRPGEKGDGGGEARRRGATGRTDPAALPGSY